MLHIVFVLLSCTSAPQAADAPAEAEPVALTASEVVITPIRAADLAKTLAKRAEKPRVVNFWATWCAPCIEEIPRLRDWARSNDEVQLVLVDMDIPPLLTKKVIPFAQKHDLGGFEHYQLSDKDPAVALQEAVPEFTGAVPFTLVIAPSGKDRKMLMGSVEMSHIEAQIEAL